MRFSRTFTGILALLPTLALAGPARLELTLKSAEEAVLKNSPRVEASRLDWEGSRARTSSQKTQLYPRLGLDGNYRYVTEIPEISFAPGVPPRAFGDNRSWSAGVSAQWTLWDWGAAYQGYQSLRSLDESKRQDHLTARKQALLAARMAYFQVRLGLEQVKLLADSLALAQAQYDDIDRRFRLGTASRIDSLSAHQEVLTRQRQLRQARADLAGHLRDLYSLTGEKTEADLSLPLDDRKEAQIPPGVEAPSLTLALEPLDSSLERLGKNSGSPPTAEVSQLASLSQAAQASRRAAKGLRAGLAPRIQVTARSSYEYPNGPVLETIQQNMVGVSATMPLFDFNRTLKDASEKQRQYEAAEKRLEQAQRDLVRDWEKAGDQLKALQDQKVLNDRAVGETGELAALVYESYKGGRSRFLDVESANLRALEARVQAARVDVQILMQTALIASLTETE